jgi:PAS domain S-box-containing protein
VLSWIHASQAATSPNTIRIGVLAKRGLDHCRKKWDPTAVYLTKMVASHRFEIVPLDFASVTHAVADQDVDFIVTNSSSYVELEDRYGIDGIATLVNRLHCGDHKVFGGVIFTRTDHPDIHTLGDLFGKGFMAVKDTSLGGWRMAWREMKMEGIDPQRAFKSIRFGGTHDAVVYAVQNHEVDAGTVRTDTLERMTAEGRIDLTGFRVLNTRAMPGEDLGFLCSTRLYPEWPMARLAHTPMQLTEQVAQALFSMKSEDPAAVAAKCAGWTYPLSYQPVHDCLKDLQLGPYASSSRESLSVVYRQYKRWIVWGGIAFFVVCFSAVCVAKLSTKLSVINADLLREVEKREKTEGQLIDSENRLQTILDRSIAGVFIIDPETHIIVDANQSALEMVGSDLSSVVGQQCHGFICPAQKGQCPITDLNQPLDRSEKVLIRSDGTERAILKTVIPIQIQGKTYLLDSFIDISELKETQFNLESALVAANQANRAKDEFLANMSHELRTPMNGILGMTTILQHTQLTDEQKEFVQIIVASSEGLLGIINDILDYATVEDGKMKLDENGFDLFDLIDEVVKEVLPKANAKALAFSHMVDETVPAFLKGDRRLLKQVIGNLMSNAVKFTHQGAVWLHAATVKEKETDCILRFSVKASNSLRRRSRLARSAKSIRLV